jgi:hypothetical protein
VVEEGPGGHRRAWPDPTKVTACSPSDPRRARVESSRVWRTTPKPRVDRGPHRRSTKKALLEAVMHGVGDALVPTAGICFGEDVRALR